MLTNCAGELDWRRHSFYVPAGEHTLRWDYARNGEETSGQDAGWLDQVSFTPGAPEAPVIVTPPQSLIITAGDDVTFGVVPEGTEPFSYQWRFN